MLGAHMKFIPDRLYNLYRKHFGTWEIEDPREIAAEAPYTFYLPPKEHLASLVIDDLVKIKFCGKPFGLDYDAERMWVIITEIIGNTLKGTLSNDPADMPQLRCVMPHALGSNANT